MKKILLLLIFLIPTFAQTVFQTPLTEQNLKEASFYSRIVSGNTVWVGESDATPDSTDRNGYSLQARVNTITKAITQANALTPGVGNQVSIIVTDARTYSETETLPDYVDLIYTNATVSNITAGTTSSSIIQLGVGAVTSVFGRTGDVVAVGGDYTASQITNAFDKIADDLDDILSGTTNKHFTATDETKLDGIEALAEVNNISDANAALLTGSANTTLHFHDADRARANHTGTQTASTISDFDTEVSNNTSVTANTAKVTNATHTGEVTGATTLTADPTIISNKTSVTATSGMEVLVNDAGTLKKVDANDFLGGGGAFTYVFKTVDESVASSTTIQNDDELTFSALANTDYVVVFELLPSGDAAGDFKYALSAPAGTTGYQGAIVQQTSGTTIASGTPNFTTEVATATGSTTWPTWLKGHFYINVGGTAGSVTLQWSQAASNATATVLRKGSYMYYAPVE